MKTISKMMMTIALCWSINSFSMSYLSSSINYVSSSVLSGYNKISNHNFTTSELIALGVTSTVIAGIAYKAFQAHTSQTPEIDIKTNFSTEKGSFGPDFSWGVGTSSCQVEAGLHTSSWSRSYLENCDKQDLVATDDSDNCDSYSAINQDIENIKHLGCNAYRFSVDWSRIQPDANTFDTQALTSYKTACQNLKKHGIKPVVCLHHYADPIWFLDQGGFAKEENIQLFVNFCNKVYEYLGEDVSEWIVISQPVAYAMKGYKTGMQAPFKINSGLEATVALNMLKAHILVYKSFHKKDDENKVGICHQVVQMKPDSQLKPLSQVAAYFANRLYNDSLLEFFKTGHFRWMVPGSTVYYDQEAPKCFDFFALSYYSPLYFDNLTTTQLPVDNQFKTDDPHRIISPQGMYDAIAQAASLGKPVYVAENGINTKDEEKRKFFLNSQLSAIEQAIKDGYDVIGYFIWTLMNNYEWGKKLEESNYGLYYNRTTWDRSNEHPGDYTNEERMLKESGKHYQSIIAKQK